MRKRKWRNAVKLRGCYALLLFLDEQGFTLTVHFEHAPPPIRAHPIIGEKNVLQFTLSLIRQFVTLIRSVWSESLQCTMFSARWSSCVCGNMREDPGNKPHLLLALFFAKTILSPFIFVARRYPQSYWILLSFPTISFSIKWLVSNSKSLCLFLCDIQKAVPGFLLVCDPYERGEHYKQPNH